MELSPQTDLNGTTGRMCAGDALLTLRAPLSAGVIDNGKVDASV